MRPVLLCSLTAMTLATGLVAATDKPDIFVGDTPAALTVTAPFAELFSAAQSDEDHHVTGTLQWTDARGRLATLDGVSISERGHTSRQQSECAFPKLKIDLSGVDRTGTAFAGLGALKLGTHCGERPDDELTPKFGRLANEQSPAREAMVYRMLDAAGVPTLLTRAARVTYIDSTPQASSTPLTRFALLLEDDDDARSRVGATAEFTEDTFPSARAVLDRGDTARLAFAEAMIGNFDWCLRMFGGDIYRCDDRHPVWNILAFKRADAPTLALPYDFDLAGPVVGRHVWFSQVFTADFTDPPSPIAVEVLSQVQRTRSLFERPVLDETRRQFMDARAAVEAAVDSSSADAQGKRLAHQYLDAFFSAIGTDDAFYRRVVVRGGTRATLDADGRRPACDGETLVPAGTPVSAPLQVRGAMTQVRLLDALWEWTGPRRCDAIHLQPVWVPTDALGSQYPG